MVFSIYSFLKDRVKKKFVFFNNLNSIKLNNKFKKKNKLNIIISKSGNTLETIANVNFFTQKGQKSVFITIKTCSSMNI